MTEPVISPIAAELVDSVSRTGITIAGMRAAAALSSEASTTNTTMVNAMCPRPPHQAGRLLAAAGMPALLPLRCPILEAKAIDRRSATRRSAVRSA